MHPEQSDSGSAPESSHEEKPDYEPVRLYRSLGWAFLPPAYAASVLGLFGDFLGASPGTGALFAGLAVLSLLMGPDRQLMDWYGLVFATVATIAFVAGEPLGLILGTVAVLFTLLTVFDELAELDGKGKMLLTGIYGFSSGLTVLIFLVPLWTTLGLSLLYLFFYLMCRLLPLGLKARASLMQDEEHE